MGYQGHDKIKETFILQLVLNNDKDGYGRIWKIKRKLNIINSNKTYKTFLQIHTLTNLES